MPNTDVILVASGSLPQPVLAVSRNSDDLAAFGPEPAGQVLVADHALQVCAGQLWDGEAATDPEVEPEEPSLPNEIAMWRIRAILARDDVEDLIDAAVEALPSDTADNREIKSMWRRGGAPNFVRDSDKVAAMVGAFSGPPLNLTWEMIDDWRARAHAHQA